jgi:diguanylate cyclase (GGDEF)-like protein/PAS domain S-box-containing protein
LRLKTLPLLNHLFVFDANGAVVASSDRVASRGLNFSDRPFMAWHRDHPEDLVHIGTPLRSKVDNRWIVVVSRRVNHADGSFAGVVDAAILLDLFQKTYDSFDLGAQGDIVLTNDSGEIFVRSPFAEANIGRGIAESPMFAGVSDTSAKAGFAYVSPIDGRERLGSYARSPGHHLIVFVAREKAEVLAAWLTGSRDQVIGLALALLTVSALGYGMVAQIRTRMKAEALYRLLTDTASDAIICADLEGNRRYLSPSFTTMTGWDAAALIGKSALEIIHPSDHPAVIQAMANLAAGDPVVIVTYRYIRPDGFIFWAEMRARLTPSPPGAPIEYVGNIRDISRQKQAEGERDAANRALAAMAMEDPLTRIANRRHFDQTLANEWKRAMRDGKPVSLLMLDADNFKSFNDTYGHVEGDNCLQTIADTLQAVIRRPGDLAARYGGEEFAAILPGATAEGAIHIAERMRALLAEQAIPHSGNTAGHVTVSIGIATLLPARNSVPSSLIALADAALYKAKQSGRDRFVVSELLATQAA